ncbi:Hypothetical_protein [Hexamita inflata]|uniref:Hypothetical_protein n=1 Tax=Hexamita inflata TaxID=28002 RepID=A0AA86RB32_9EUKA|nr:Hypothetical protein HINF_LOCUS52570 [Hexamita inflata]
MLLNANYQLVGLLCLSVQPADLARQIVQRANARIEGRDPDEVCAVEKTSQQMEYEEMKRRQQEEEEYYQEQTRRDSLRNNIIKYQVPIDWILLLNHNNK